MSCTKIPLEYEEDALAMTSLPAPSALEKSVNAVPSSTYEIVPGAVTSSSVHNLRISA